MFYFCFLRNNEMVTYILGSVCFKLILIRYCNELFGHFCHLCYWIKIEAYWTISNQIDSELNRDPKNRNWIALWGSWQYPALLAGIMAARAKGGRKWQRLQLTLNLIKTRLKLSVVGKQNLNLTTKLALKTY